MRGVELLLLSVFILGVPAGEVVVVAVEGKPVGREGDVGTVKVPFLVGAEFGREFSRTLSDNDDDFERGRELLGRLRGVGISSAELK